MDAHDDDDSEDLESQLSEGSEAAATETAVAEPAFEKPKRRLALEVEVRNVGPCKKHVRVKVPTQDIDYFRSATVDEKASKAVVPGFRKGHVPKSLILRRFRKELADDVKQRVLIESLEQLSQDHELDPINEPNLDVENLEIPDKGDFQYEFDVEVRPEFTLPPYESLTIERPSHDVTEADVDGYLDKFLSDYAQRVEHPGPAEKGDFITASFVFTHGERTLGELNDASVRLFPVLRFHDAQIERFDELMAGVAAGEQRQVRFPISSEALLVEMRGETVQATISVSAVKRLEKPELNKEFLRRLEVESEDELRYLVSNTLERQVVFQQRQSARQQVLAKITESADWDLPEELVRKQVENAMHREILEMEQAGFTPLEIRARENQIRQRAVSTTRQAMKEHFVLDKIAVQEGIEVTPAEIEAEIRHMAQQRGESPRRLRAKLAKSGLNENLEAQIRERKAVDVVLSKAVFKDVEVPWDQGAQVEAVDYAICGNLITAAVKRAEEQGV